MNVYGRAIEMKNHDILTETGDVVRSEWKMVYRRLVTRTVGVVGRLFLSETTLF